jgi:hypothetical protein
MNKNHPDEDLIGRELPGLAIGILFFIIFLFMIGLVVFGLIALGKAIL